MSEFPVVIECAPVDSFMRDSFKFEYTAPELRVNRCGHSCYGTDCGHGVCCRNTDMIEMVLSLFDFSFRSLLCFSLISLIVLFNLVYHLIYSHLQGGCFHH